MCEDRHAEVNASEASYVALDRYHDSWPGSLAVRFRRGCVYFLKSVQGTGALVFSLFPVLFNGTRVARNAMRETNEKRKALTARYQQGNRA